MTLNNSKIHFILLAGGNSLRFSSNTNKLLAKFKNKNLLIHNIEFIKELKFKKITLISNNLKNTNIDIFDGLEVIRKVISKSKYLLKLNGKLILEIGSDQRYSVTNFLKEKNFFINNIIKDYGKNIRCIVSTKIS